MVLRRHEVWRCIFKRKESNFFFKSKTDYFRMGKKKIKDEMLQKVRLKEKEERFLPYAVKLDKMELLL